MIIDGHTHCYPDECAAAPRAWAASRKEEHWADLVAPLDRKSIQGWAGPETFLREMDSAGVDQAVLLGWYWEHESTCRWHNRVIASWISRAPDRFIGFAAILPNENVVDQLEEARALGLRGVGELHPGVQGFDSRSSAWRALAEWCSTHGWPINFHTTSEQGRDHPAAVATPLQDYLRMAHEHPTLKMILAHWGGGLALQTDKNLPKNLFFDCAASPLLFSTDPFREAIEAVGADRILFGSDYPLRVYPRVQKQADMGRFLEKIRSEAGLTPLESEAILGGNWLRLMNEP